MQQYKNTDGTYTSPTNGKVYKSEKALRAHLSFRKTEKFHNFSVLNKVKECCKFCSGEIGITNISKHEKSCFMNPENLVECAVCNNPIKDYAHSKGTCSRSCANKHFRSGEDNGNYKNAVSNYVATCYRHHEKKCVVCGEVDAVDVHHLDKNTENNSVDNLIPLCPTHHAYCHRGLFSKIESKIQEYLKEFNLRFA